MKRSIVLLSLLSSVMMFSPQSMGMEESKEGISTVGKGGQLEASSFTQELRSIVDNHGNNKDQLQQRVKKQYDDRIELQEDLIKDGGFSNDERTLLFDIAKELNLPIIVGTDSHGISLFSIYKGQSIEDKTRINHKFYYHVNSNHHAAHDKLLRLTTFFISDHFTSLNKINLEQNRLTDLRLPINLPYLECLKLEGNYLTQLTLGDMPKLHYLDLTDNHLAQLTLGDMANLKELSLLANQLTQLKLGDMPKLDYLDLENNQLTQLKLGDMPKLDYLDLSDNRLTQLTLGNMPKLDRLYLLNNQLTQLKLGDMPKLNRLYLQGNKIKKLNFLKSNMPNLRHLELENNPLKNLTLPYAVSHRTGLINKDRVIDIAFNGVIPSITAFYCPSGANAFNEKKTVDFSVLDPKKHTFKNMNFLNEVERERNCRKILRWMAACNKS